MLKLRGLYYITHIDNLTSILQKGILSHKKIEEEKIPFTPIYDSEIVASRKNRKVSGEKTLWHFANLYFQPRNAMLYRVIYFVGLNVDDLVIIGLKSRILERDDIFIATGNAASPQTKILPAPAARKIFKSVREKCDREWWAVEDGSKREMMAECLFPDDVSADYISEIYVHGHEAMKRVKNEIADKDILVIPEPELFFLPSRRISLTEKLSLVEGDMFFSRMQTLAVSVNTMGVMGKGVASRAKYQFPDVYVTYQDLCKGKILKMGKPHLYKRETSLDFVLTDEAEKLPNFNLQTWFLLFPTKTDWRKPADMKGIAVGMRWLAENYKKEGITSLAIPALGCGLGWLPWGEVGPILCGFLKKLDIPVNLYLPVEKKIPEEQLFGEFLLREV